MKHVTPPSFDNRPETETTSPKKPSEVRTESMEALGNVAVGDVVCRWLAGLDSPMELRVTAVAADRIVCGWWEFDWGTGAEIDEDLGWGPTTITGSYIRVTPVKPENN